MFYITEIRKSHNIPRQRSYSLLQKTNRDNGRNTQVESVTVHSSYFKKQTKKTRPQTAVVKIYGCFPHSIRGFLYFQWTLSSVSNWISFESTDVGSTAKTSRNESVRQLQTREWKCSYLSHPHDSVRLCSLVPGNNMAPGTTMYFNKKHCFLTVFTQTSMNNTMCAIQFPVSRFSHTQTSYGYGPTVDAT